MITCSLLIFYFLFFIFFYFLFFIFASEKMKWLQETPPDFFVFWRLFFVVFQRLLLVFSPPMVVPSLPVVAFSRAGDVRELCWWMLCGGKGHLWATLDERWSRQDNHPTWVSFLSLFFSFLCLEGGSLGSPCTSWTFFIICASFFFFLEWRIVKSVSWGSFSSVASLFFFFFYSSELWVAQVDMWV